MRIKRISLIALVLGLLIPLGGALVVATPAAALGWVGGWNSPLNRTISLNSGFLDGGPGYPSYVSGKYHTGNDFYATSGEGVYSIGAGTVFAVQDGWPGNAVFVRHTSANGASFLAVYGHINSTVAVGTTVAAGSQIGTVYNWGGNTHLHFGIRTTISTSGKNGSQYIGSWPGTNSFVDPIPYLINNPVTGTSGATRLITPGDFNGDGFKDLLNIRANGDLALFASNGAGGWLNGFGTVVGAGWGAFSHAFSPGDFTGDGKSDVIGVLPNGNMMLYSGNGAGGWLNGIGTLISTGNTWAQMIAPGDFNGDGNADVMGVTASGDLWLYTGNGAGGWLNGNGTAIGAGFAGVKFLVTPGDFSGDGKTDLIATLPNGDLRMYTGNGAGGWANGNGILIGSGFAATTRMVGPGDWNGDGNADVIATLTNGQMKVYTGNGAGGWLNGSGILIGSGW